MMGVPTHDPSRLISMERLRELVSYDPETGHFTNLTKRSSNANIGAIAGGVKADFYWFIRLDGIGYKAHRLAWFYVYGAWPRDQIDHINGNPTDNRIVNLREANTSQNVFNSPLIATNKSGYKGVHWAPHRKKWIAKVTHKGKTYSLGGFDKVEDAYAAYCLKAKEIAGMFFNPGVRHG